MSDKKMKTDFLVAVPSFASGMARLFDWGGTFDVYNGSGSVTEADAKAMFSDWRMVGQDLLIAMNQAAETEI